jgi:NADP-dependent 3-hydroxy acid dehydrogenase YdfG
MQKTAVVGGATGGIGEAVVGALVTADYRVFALGRTVEKLGALQGRHSLRLPRRQSVAREQLRPPDGYRIELIDRSAK